jgi:hypothetical protein
MISKCWEGWSLWSLVATEGDCKQSSVQATPCGNRKTRPSCEMQASTEALWRVSSVALICGAGVGQQVGASDQRTASPP